MAFARSINPPIFPLCGTESCPGEVISSKKTPNFNDNIAYFEPRPGTKEEPLYDLNEKLWVFLGRLKSFVADAYFYSENFSANAPQLSVILVEISRNVENVHAPYSDLREPLRFAIYVYRVMMETTDLIKTFNGQTKAQHLVRSMYRINVALLTLPIHYVTPNSYPGDYVDNLYAYGDIIDRWILTFQSLGNLPHDIQSVFYQQFHRAEQTIDDLEWYVPQQGRMTGHV